MYLLKNPNVAIWRRMIIKLTEYRLPHFWHGHLIFPSESTRGLQDSTKESSPFVNSSDTRFGRSVQLLSIGMMQLGKKVRFKEELWQNEEQRIQTRIDDTVDKGRLLNPLFEYFISYVNMYYMIVCSRKIRQHFPLAPKYICIYIPEEQKGNATESFLNKQSCNTHSHPKWDKVFKKQSQNGDNLKLITKSISGGYKF